MPLETGKTAVPEKKTENPPVYNIAEEKKAMEALMDEFNAKDMSKVYTPGMTVLSGSENYQEGSGTDKHQVGKIKSKIEAIFTPDGHFIKGMVQLFRHHENSAAPTVVGAPLDKNLKIMEAARAPMATVFDKSMGHIDFNKNGVIERDETLGVRPFSQSDAMREISQIAGHLKEKGVAADKVPAINLKIMQISDDGIMTKAESDWLNQAKGDPAPGKIPSAPKPDKSKGSLGPV